MRVLEGAGGVDLFLEFLDLFGGSGDLFEGGAGEVDFDGAGDGDFRVRA